MRKGFRKGVQTLLVLSMMVQTALPGFSSITFGETPNNIQDIQDIQEETTFFTTNEEPVKRRMLFNEGWKFLLGDPANAQAKVFDDSSWRGLDLPHDWSIEFDFDMNSLSRSEGGYLNGGTGWYRKSFVLPEKMDGKRISIDFDGVYMDSNTYVNGKFIANYPNGYTPFSYDITDSVVADGVTENIIAIKAVNRQPSSRWYSGSGIYRNVNLTVTDAVHVKRYGTFITTPNIEKEYKTGNITVDLETHVVNNTDEEQTVVVKSTIMNMDGEQLGETSVSEPVEVAANTTKKVEDNMTATNPQLWSVDNPNMYKMSTEIEVDGIVKDEYETRFGFRYFMMDKNEGFSLNGQWMKLKGVCMHHDQGALGAVANRRAIERQMQILQDMGVNAIRVSHNPAANELIEVCEDMGLLVIDEAFDTWYGGKKPYDYSKFFEKLATHPDAVSGMTWAEYDLKEMVHRGKNSPAIIMWSLGNEVGEANGSARAMETVKNLVKWTKEVDTTRLTTMGFDAFRMNEGGGHNSVANELDSVGFNYAEAAYDSRHGVWPEWLMYGSETSSATKSRGVYAHPDKEGEHDGGAHPDFQQSSYGNDRVGWGKTAANAWIPDRDRQFIAGQFIWTGFDYIGEPTPWHNSNQPPKSSYFGMIDTAGFPKDDYYFYQSQWKDVKRGTMVHIYPHWNWEDKKLASQVTVNGKIPVRVYTNAKKVELFKDGESQGVREFETLTTNYGIKYQQVTDKQLYLEWRLPYEPGTLKAVAMDADGKVLATESIVSAGAPAGVKLSADRNIITADGDDLSYITVDIVDKDGNFMPTADNTVSFNITGNGRIVGVDNGNALTHERYKDTDGIWKRKAFNGKALIIVQSTPDAGSFTLSATSAGLKADTLSVFTVEEGETETKILGYNIPKIFINTGVALELPSEIQAIYSDGDSKMVDVTWEDIDVSLLGKPGVITINGAVTDNNDKIQIEVTITGIIGIKEKTVITGIGQLPTSPTTVDVVYSDGSVINKPVTWEREVVADEVATVGSVIIEGTIKDVIGFKAKVIIKVTDEVENKDIAISNSIIEGYPKATASYEGGDKVANIIDGSSVFATRWTNWVNGNGRGEIDWVALEFEKEYTIKDIDLSFFTDGSTQVPAKIIVETSKDGTNWDLVSNQSKTEGFSVTQGDVTTKYPISFDPVSMKHIRIQLTGKPNGANFRPVGLTEVYVYGDVLTEGSKVAELTQLNLDGELIDGFKTDQYRYTKELIYGEAIPVVTVAAKDNGTTFIVPALAHGSSTVIQVTSEDGKTTKDYFVEFISLSAALISSEISLTNNTITEDDIVDIKITNTLEDDSVIDNKLARMEYKILPNNSGEIEIIDGKIYAYKSGTVQIQVSVTYNGTEVKSNVLEIKIRPNTEEKKIVSYDAVAVLTDKGMAPTLPKKVKAIFDKGLPQQVDVTWDDIDSELYANYGELTVNGTVEGQILKPKAKILVKGAVATQQFTGATPVGVLPVLPENAMVYFSDGTSEKLAVKWGSHNVADFGSVGTKIIAGTIIGTDLKTTIKIRISDETIKSQNVAKQWTGSTLPSGIASFTNRENGSKDIVTAINDTVVSFNDLPINRWTNWQPTARKGDWVGILFAKGGDMATQFVDHMRIGFFQDSGTSAPANFKVQYYIPQKAPEFPRDVNLVANEATNSLNLEENWADVTGLICEDTVLPVDEMTEFNFDMVETYAIRIKMDGKTSKGLAVTEMELYGKEATPNATFDVTDIELDGKSIDNFNQDTLSYNIDLPSGHLPEGTAIVTNNAAVTVISANDTNGVTKLVITAENGITTKTYRLNFTDTSEGTDNVTLTVQEDLESGKEFIVTVGMKNIEKPVYAHDITLKYNPELITFHSVEAVGANEQVSDGAGIKHNKELGILRILGVCFDGERLLGSNNLFEFNFIANETEIDKTGNIRVHGDVATVKNNVSEIINLGEVERSIYIKGNGEPQEPEDIDRTELIIGIDQAVKEANSAVVGEKEGQYLQSDKDALRVAIERAKKVSTSKEATQDDVNQALMTLKQELYKFKASIIKKTDHEADVNGDGKVDLKDLEYVASYYRAKQGQVDWEQAKNIDINGDGKIDVQDLVFVAKRILDFK